MLPRIQMLLSMIEESKRQNLLSENFGKLAPLMLKAGPLSKVFTTAMKSPSSTIGQGSSLESSEKIKYADLQRMLRGEIMMQNGDDLLGFVVFVNGAPVFAYASNGSKKHNGYKGHFAAYRQGIQFAFFGDIDVSQYTAPIGSPLNAILKDASDNLYKAVGVDLPIRRSGTSRAPGEDTVIKPNLDTKVFVNPLAAASYKSHDIAKRVSSMIQNIMNWNNRVRVAFGKPEVKFTIVGVGHDPNRVEVHGKRVDSRLGSIPLPNQGADRVLRSTPYNDYIKSLSYNLKSRLERFKMDKLLPSIKKMSMEDFNDPAKLTSAIRDSKVFEQEALKIGPFTYKLKKLEAGHSWSNLSIKAPHGTLIQTLEFKYEIVEGDREARDEMMLAWREKSKEVHGKLDIDDDEAIDRYKADRTANVPPTEYSGEAHIFINLLNLADTRIEVKKVTANNW